MADHARMELLRKTVEKSPNVEFPRYGLAMELVSDSQLDEAEQHFQKLLEYHPEHISGHFMLGKLYGQLGRIDDSRATLIKGIEIARQKGDIKNMDEMQDELEQLE